MTQIKVRRQYTFPARTYYFDAEDEKPPEQRRPNFNAAKLTDEAIADGRITRGERDWWLREFEHAPYYARRALAEKKPDQLHAARNLRGDPEYCRYFRAMAGMEPPDSRSETT
jgi:hypothetical protein